MEKSKTHLSIEEKQDFLNINSDNLRKEITRTVNNYSKKMFDDNKEIIISNFDFYILEMTIVISAISRFFAAYLVLSHQVNNMERKDMKVLLKNLFNNITKQVNSIYDFDKNIDLKEEYEKNDEETMH